MTNRKTYKAYVTDKETGERKVISCGEYSRKADVLGDIRHNGYKCSNFHCKEEKVFNWVWEEIMKCNNEKEYHAIWRFPRIPKNDEEYEAMMEKYQQQYLRDYARTYAHNKTRQFERQLSC